MTHCTCGWVVLFGLFFFLTGVVLAVTERNGVWEEVENAKWTRQKGTKSLGRGNVLEKICCGL